MEWDSWFQNKNFTSDWTSGYYEIWVRHLDKFRDRDVSILEIGSWEGRSAVFFLEFLPRSRITCVDTFEGGAEHAVLAETASIESRFDSNLASYGDRVRKIKSRSFTALDQLAQENETFDLIYIDGSHVRDDVLVDSLLAWRLLAASGICIWDDYIWGVTGAPSAQRPQHAIDAFLEMHSDELQVRHAAAQVIAEKCPGGQPQNKTHLTFPRTVGNLMRFLTRQPLQPSNPKTG